MARKNFTRNPRGGCEEQHYHHCMPLSQVAYTPIHADPAYSAGSYLVPAYEWLAEQIGFFPHFVSVGMNRDALYRTGYQDNWRVCSGGEFVNNQYQKTYRKSGEFPNNVLFSFDNLEGIFMDFDYWHIAINECTNGGNVSKREMDWILKPTWTQKRWLRAATDQTHSVDLLVPEIPLNKSAKVQVRNRATQKIIETMGFHNVMISRLRVAPTQ